MAEQSSRRDVLKVGLGALPVIATAGSVPGFVAQMAFAEQAVGTGVANDNVLVVVQLTGGNDGLNTLIPFADDAYMKARPRIGLKDEAVRLDDHFGLHPGLLALKALYDQGKVAAVHGCGYPNPNRSHFRSMEIWHTANPREAQQTGWLGHYLDHVARSGTGPVMALNIGAELPQALVNTGAPVPSVERLDEFRLKSAADPARAKAERDIIMGLNRARGEAAGESPALRFLARQATNAIVATEKVHERAAGGSTAWYGGSDLGNQLQLIANLIAAQSGTRVFYAQTGGYDTHASQRQAHQQLMAQLGAALGGFCQDLSSKGLFEKVAVLVFSEFGRRVMENSSQGTDHGAAAPVFVIGGKVRGGLHGKAPSLTDLDDGDLKYTTDFRRVYATLLDRWLNADATKVLGARFEPVAFL